jgi:hypothetical protein
MFNSIFKLLNAKRLFTVKEKELSINQFLEFLEVENNSLTLTNLSAYKRVTNSITQ